MRIAVGSDHRGVELRAKLIGFLQELGQEVVDVGSHERRRGRLSRCRRAGGPQSGQQGSRSRHSVVRDGRGHVHRGQQDSRRAGRSLPRRHHGRSQPPPQRSERLVSIRRLAGREACRSAGGDLAEDARSMAAVTPGATRRSSILSIATADRDRESGGIGRRAGLRIQWGNPCRFNSCLSHFFIWQGLATTQPASCFLHVSGPVSRSVASRRGVASRCPVVGP